MSKDIWHTKDEIPRQESRVVWKSGNVVCGGRFDTHYKCFCGPASQFVDLKTVSRWAYIDDLIALETELERTRKALDKGMEHITGLNNMIKSWLNLIDSDLDQETKLHILKSAISTYVENKGSNNE